VAYAAGDERISVMPRGFYLRASFTASVFRDAPVTW
jgi:DNA mismatch repair protein MutH